MVSSGLSCACVCPECSEPLIARKGTKMAWHFAHKSGAECVTAPETALHKMAKQFLLDAGAVVCPRVVSYSNDYGRPDFELHGSEIIKASKMGSEDAFGDVIPDIWIRSLDGRGFFIEIKVTHGVDDVKREKLRRLGVPTIEADFSNVARDLPPDEFMKEAARIFTNAYWAWHPLIDKFDTADKQTRIKMLHDPFERLLCEGRCPECGGDLDVYWFFDEDDDGDHGFWVGDCSVCGRAHCALHDGRGFVHICKDGRICPECGSWMSLRHGKFGEFWGCNRYPHCHKTIPGWR